MTSGAKISRLPGMMNLSFLLATRLIRSRYHERSITLMFWISLSGIIIGSGALALVAAVMEGFEQETHKKLQGVHSDLIIRADGDPIDVDAVRRIVTEKFPAISAIAPRAHSYVITRSPRTGKLLSLSTIIGIDPLAEAQTSNLAQTVIEPTKKMPPERFVEWLKQGIALGKSQAQSLGVSVGDMVTLYYAPDIGSQRKVSLATFKAPVSLIFKTGVDEFDAGTIFTSLAFFAELFPDTEITSLGARTTTFNESMRQDLERELDADVSSWKELYPALVSALILEKYAMFFILALVTLVAAINIVSLIFMIITNKRRELAILQTLGLPASKIVHIFTLVGVGMATIGATIGITIAIFLSYILNTYKLISLPDVYYVSHLPAHMNAAIIISVFFTVVFLGFVSSIYAARASQTISLATLLKFE